jgi:hypothetical protein
MGGPKFAQLKLQTHGILKNRSLFAVVIEFGLFSHLKKRNFVKK